jgi:anti-anti-sigma factor
MEIELRSLESGLLCLKCRGVISHPYSGQADDPLRLIGDWRGKVLLNLEQTEYIDSSGVAWLVHWHRKLVKAGGVFALCAVPPRVADVLRLCQVHTILPIWEEEAAARAALTAPTPLGPPNSSAGLAQG